MYYHLIQQGHSKTEQVVENNNLKELAERTINAVHPGRSRNEPLPFIGSFGYGGF